MGSMAGKKEAIVGVFCIALVVMVSLVSAGWGDWWDKITGRATSGNIDFNISVTAIAPVVYNVTFIPSQSITIDDMTRLAINFSVNDSDGVANLNDTSAFVNVSIQGASTGRWNGSCLKINSAGFYANYSCTVNVWYFDNAGTWNVTARVGDASGLNGTNTSAVFVLASTLAVTTSPAALTYGSLSPGAVNQTPTNTPIQLNNSGNQNVTAGNIQVNATNLKGEQNQNYAIYAANFSVSENTTSLVECGASTSQLMSRSVYVGIGGANLSSGNYSVNNGATGQERLYACLREVGRELPSQAYSTAGPNNDGPWVVKVQ